MPLDVNIQFMLATLKTMLQGLGNVHLGTAIARQFLIAYFQISPLPGGNRSWLL